ncbi:MAG TPA: DUF481 domain-containing protein [Blastocatellia bacterium]|nr:DUF481 domain-containing protein [Blastocatellia bacterium]
MNYDSLLKVARSLIWLPLALIGLSASADAKRTDDVVVLKNGDHLTGEIKSLEHGELTFKNDYMLDSVRLDWKWVVRLESKDRYLVTLTSGQVFTALISLRSVAVANRPDFLMQTGDASLSVRPVEVLKILPDNRRFWKQLNGTIDLGFSYTAGDNQYQTQFSASAAYDGQGYEVTGDVSSSFDGQSGGGGTSYNALNSQYRRLFKQKWFFGGLADLLNSEEQSLDLRTSLGGIVGRRFIQTSRTSLSVFTGAAGTRERYSSAAGRRVVTGAESLLGLDFSTFRFRTLDLSARLLVWPSLTEPGRLRMGFNSSLRVELRKNLFWNLSLYDNFDRQPPVNARKNDLGISNSFGWKF